jgi:hypothetical protein
LGGEAFPAVGIEFLLVGVVVIVVIGYLSL